MINRMKWSAKGSEEITAPGHLRQLWPVCTARNPWKKSRGMNYDHPDMELVESVSYGDAVTMYFRCPHCGGQFYVEYEGEEVVL